jgi:hypothetical protein
VVGGHQVHAREPVDLQVDEPGRGDAAPRAAETHVDDRPGVHGDVAGEEPPVDQRGLHAQPHPFTAPAVRAVMRCLRASTKTIATGSV